MKLTFIGAAHEVTGSCHFLNACGKNILIDCGMEQGEDIYENQKLSVNAADIDYVLITHAHIDHTGLVPLLYSRGFRGRILATEATCDLCDILLRDSAHIQMQEAEWKNRKGKRSGTGTFIPLYEMKDVLGAIKQFDGYPYDKRIQLCEGIEIRFSDVGHLLGSASIEIWVNENGTEQKIVFSGDIGNDAKPLIKDPTYIDDADFVVMESTYGDRNHNETKDFLEEIVRITSETFKRGGNLVIPAFAVGRTQEMLYYFRKIKSDRLIPEFPDFKVYMDSPLAIEATNVFHKNKGTCFSEEATELVKQGINPISFPGLKYAITSDESKLINFDETPKVIISASGMCEAGRIKHHLKHNLWREDSTILFVGYQAVGTLGRSILEGAQEVKIFGEQIEVKAKIEKIEGFSGHADQSGLIRWLTSFNKKPKKVFLVHGEDSVIDGFAELLTKQYGYDVYAPYTGAVYDLTLNKEIAEGITERIEGAKSKTSRQISAVFARLLAAGQRLMSVIQHNEGGTNKDLGKFADQINSMCDKWDR